MVQAIFLTIGTLSAVIPTLAIPIVRASLTVNDGAPVPQGFPHSILRRRDLLALSPGMRPSAFRRELSVELEAREPIVILPGMNPNIDTRLPWNRDGPRVLVLKREFMEGLD